MVQLAGTQAGPAEPAWADTVLRSQITIRFLETPSVSSPSHKGGEQDDAGTILWTGLSEGTGWATSM